METVLSSAAYRSGEAAARLRWSELAAVQQTEIARLGDRVAIVARRAGRIAGGMAAAACGVAAMGGAVAAELVPTLESLGLAPWFLVAGAPLGVATALVARAAASRMAWRRLRAMLVPSARPLDDVARLERKGVAARANAWLDRHERASYAWPLIGVALVGPLLLHLIVHLATVDPSADAFVSFSTWIAASVVIAAAPHIAFVVLSVQHARRLEIGESYNGWAALGWITASSLFPWALLLGLPPLITFATGLLLVPTSFAVVRRIAEGEAAEIASH